MIWLIGGTSETRPILNFLLENQQNVILSVTTRDGKEGLPGCENLTIIEKKLVFSQMLQLINQHKIRIVIDASHPYASQVSLNAISACQKTKVIYLRYERKSASMSTQSLYYFPDYPAINHFLKQTNGKILVTVGSNHIHDFNQLPRDRLYVRILPTLTSLQKCLACGILTSHIIAAQGPFSTQFNLAQMREHHIRYLVTKDSGKAGGFDEKIAAALELGVEILVLQKPGLVYPLLFEEINGLKAYLLRIM